MGGLELRECAGDRTDQNGIIDFFFFQAEDGIRDDLVTGVQTCALPISHSAAPKLADELVRTDSRTLKRRSSLGPLRQSWVVSVFVSLRLSSNNPCRRGRGDRKSVV